MRNRMAILALDDLSKKGKIAIVEKANSDLFQSLIESVKNIILGNVPLDSEQFIELQRYKKELHKLSGRGRVDDKRKILIQSGRGNLLDAIITPIVSVLSSIKR